MAKYYSKKKYGHERGLSAAFRQWGAESHCRFIHGYSLEFEFVFGAHELDENNWVVDFGGLKELELWLRQNFDHKTLVAFCLLYTSPSPRDGFTSRMPSSA